MTWHIQAAERCSWSMELLERGGGHILQGLLDLGILIFIVRLGEKQWKEFSVEGEEEDVTIKFMFQKCHSGYSVTTD